jgi:hypothetical protein
LDLDQLLDQLVEGGVVEVELSLERAEGDAPVAFEKGSSLLDGLQKAHRSCILPRKTTLGARAARGLRRDPDAAAHAENFLARAELKRRVHLAATGPDARPALGPLCTASLAGTQEVLGGPLTVSLDGLAPPHTGAVNRIDTGLPAGETRIRAGSSGLPLRSPRALPTGGSPVVAAIRALEGALGAGSHTGGIAGNGIRIG